MQPSGHHYHPTIKHLCRVDRTRANVCGAETGEQLGAFIRRAAGRKKSSSDLEGEKVMLTMLVVMAILEALLKALLIAGTGCPCL
jgi:hypothetical protein